MTAPLGRLIHLVATAVFASVVLLATPAAAGFALETVLPGQPYSHVTLATAPSGEIYAVAGREPLTVWISDGSGWRTETINDTACADDLSLAFDDLGRPAIAFYEASARALFLARSDGAGWSIEQVDGLDSVGRSPSLAFDDAGQPWIAYMDVPAEQLKVAHHDGLAWQVERVFIGGGPAQPSLAIGPGGAISVAYREQDAERLEIVRRDGAGWDRDVIEDLGGDRTGQRPALAFTSDGREVIAYGSFDALRLASWDGGGWMVDVIDTTFIHFGIALVLDGGDRPHVAVQDFTGTQHYEHDGNAWQKTTIDSSRAVSSVDLDLSPSGDPVVGYIVIAAEVEQVRAGQRDGGAWAIDTLAVAANHSQGLDLAFDAAGRPALSQQTDDGDVWLSRFDGLSWSTEWIGTVGVGLHETRIEFDGAGNPLVLFGGVGENWAAWWDGSSWEYSEVAPASTPTHLGLRFAPDGRPSAAWCDSTGIGVGFSHHDGTAWQDELLFTERAWGCSLAYDGGGHPAVVFFVADELRIARHDGAGWNLEAILADVLAGNTAVEVGATGDILVAFTRLGSDTIELARHDGGAWSIEEVAEGGLVNDMTLDPAGRPAIAFMNSPEARIARHDGTTWRVERAWSGAIEPHIGFDPAGNTAVGVGLSCRGDLALVREVATNPIILHRGTVDALVPGWRAGALPLGRLNDDETPPFPIAATEPAVEDDPLPTGAPLILYRALDPGGAPLGNGLRAVRTGATVSVFYAP